MYNESPFKAGPFLASPYASGPLSLNATTVTGAVVAARHALAGLRQKPFRYASRWHSIAAAAARLSDLLGVPVGAKAVRSLAKAGKLKQAHHPSQFSVVFR